MGLFDKLFPRQTQTINGHSYWQLLNGYVPVFTTWNGSLYESELVRAAIDARSRHISKLQITTTGGAKPRLANRLKYRPNDFQTWTQILYRINTILDMQATCFICPIEDRYGETVGITTLLPNTYELINVEGEPWLRFEFTDGSHAAIELSKVGIMVKYQYDSDFFGSKNTALKNTMGLLDIQRQGIEEAVRAGASYKFWAKATNFTKTEDLKKERKRFSIENLQTDDGGGILLFPNTYNEIHQADVKPYTVDYNTLQLIQDNVANYFGVNKHILQNIASPEEMDAFYNGCVEPFAIQLQEVLTKMLYTDQEISRGSGIVVTANRLQYMTTKEKVNLVQQLADRGMITINEARELFNYAPIPGGDKAPIRGEFKQVGDGDNFDDFDNNKEEEPDAN